jgi:hypothetical protein
MISSLGNVVIPAAGVSGMEGWNEKKILERISPYH